MPTQPKPKPCKRYRTMRVPNPDPTIGGTVKVYVHRWRMEQHLGRPLATDEYVHHVNGDRLNNNIANLKILTPAEHQNEHHRRYPQRRTCPMCKRRFSPLPKETGRQVTCSRVCGTGSGILKRWGHDAFVAWATDRGHVKMLNQPGEQLSLLDLAS